MTTETSESRPTSGEPMETRSLWSRIAGVAADVGRRRRGERAQLRRVGPTGALPAVFWNLVKKYQIKEGYEEEFFIHLMPAMAKYAHDPNRRPGGALRKAGVSPARFERWLRQDKHTAWRETRRILAQLEGGIDWGELGQLLFHWDHPEWGEANRRRIARDFFLTRPPGEREDLETEPSIVEEA